MRALPSAAFFVLAAQLASVAMRDDILAMSLGYAGWILGAYVAATLGVGLLPKGHP